MNLRDVRPISCPDCVPVDVTVGHGRSTTDGSTVILVLVEHAPSCPWSGTRAIPFGCSAVSEPETAYTVHVRAGEHEPAE